MGRGSSATFSSPTSPTSPSGHPDGIPLAIKRSRNSLENTEVEQFHAEKKAFDHIQRVDNPFALHLRCPMITTPHHIYLAMELAPGRDLFEFFDAHIDYAEHVREMDGQYPDFFTVHVAVARFIAAQFLLFFKSADKTAEAKGTDEAIGPFLALDIELDNVLLAGNGGIKVGHRHSGFEINPKVL